MELENAPAKPRRVTWEPSEWVEHGGEGDQIESYWAQDLSEEE